MLNIELSTKFCNAAVTGYNTVSTNALVRTYALTNYAYETLATPDGAFDYMRPLFDNGRSAGRSVASVRLMSGVMPEEPNLALNDRADDILVEYFHNSNYGTELVDLCPFPFTATTQSSTDYLVVSARPKQPTKSGKATWLWIVSYVYGTDTVYHQVICDVGTEGSGAAVELPSVDLTEDQPIAIRQIKLGVPTVIPLLASPTNN